MCQLTLWAGKHFQQIQLVGAQLASLIFDMFAQLFFILSHKIPKVLSFMVTFGLKLVLMWIMFPGIQHPVVFAHWRLGFCGIISSCCIWMFSRAIITDWSAASTLSILDSSCSLGW